MSGRNETVALGPTVLGHPLALFILVFAAACEHFAFFGVRSLLRFYFTDPIDGPGWDMTETIALYGTFSVATYAAYIPGGIVADRITGAKHGVLIGGLVMVCGCLLLAFPVFENVYVSLGLVALGVGLMRPSLWTMIGRMYAQGDSRRDVGFSVLFVAVNLGSAMSSLGVAYAHDVYGWSVGFCLAAGGGILGICMYAWGTRYFNRLAHVVPSEKDVTGRSLTTVEVQRSLVVGIVVAVVSLSSAVQGFSSESMYYAALQVEANWILSLYSVFALLLALPVAYLWTVWKRRGHESSSLLKITFGVLLTTWALLFALPFLGQLEPGASPWVGWLVIPQVFIAIGSLFMTPIAWSFVTKLAPLKYASTTMGIFFAAMGLIGSFVFRALSGSGMFPDENGVMTVIAATVFCTLLGVGVIAALKPLKRLTHGAEEEQMATGPAAPVETVNVGGANVGAGGRFLFLVLFLLVANAILAALDAPFWIY